jgi:hypothetical protein
MIYAADATLLSVIPVSYAIALIVSLELTDTGVEYKVPTVSLGVLPSVV